MSIWQFKVQDSIWNWLINPIMRGLCMCIIIMMTSSNGNIFRVTGPLCGEFTGPGEFPAQRPVTRSFDVFFNLRPNRGLRKHSWGWWFKTPSHSLWRHCNDILPKLPPLCVVMRKQGLATLNIYKAFLCGSAYISWRRWKEVDSLRLQTIASYAK